MQPRQTVQPRQCLRGVALAFVAVLMVVVWSGLGCNSAAALANGIAPCTADSDCPNDYHCASELTC